VPNTCQIITRFSYRLCPAIWRGREGVKQGLTEDQITQGENFAEEQINKLLPTLIPKLSSKEFFDQVHTVVQDDIAGFGFPFFYLNDLFSIITIKYTAVMKRMIEFSANRLINQLFV